MVARAWWVKKTYSAARGDWTSSGVPSCLPYPSVTQVNARELRELEKRCIQEEAPTCVARCPIHVDVRAFLKKAASGLWEEARQVLAVTMPFPGIVGRICDHPCQQACRRAEAGDAIAIADLERATVERAGQSVPPTSLPIKELRVAVIGSGLSSLTAALDISPEKATGPPSWRRRTSWAASCELFRSASCPVT